MKCLDVVERIVKTRREKVTLDTEYRKSRSASLRKAWADGKFEGVQTGKCKWYNHTRSDGSVVKLQGTWGVVFAQWLDKQGTQYEAHRGIIKYIDSTAAAGIERSYYPDFYVPAENRYYDVKGAYFDDLQKHKFEFIAASNPLINVKIVIKQSFSDLGIDISKASKIIP